jgi:pimeloyl-ACP methyl ester carboxylesterase
MSAKTRTADRTAVDVAMPDRGSETRSSLRTEASEGLRLPSPWSPSSHQRWQPPTEEIRRIRVDGYEMAARTWATDATAHRTPMVLVHGLGVASRMCRPVAERLAEHHPVHAVDLLGFGLSGQPPEVLDIDALADSLAGWIQLAVPGPVVVVGVSLGAQVTAALAHRHRELCAAAVLASPIVEPSRRTWPRQVVRWQAEQATQSMGLRRIQLADYAACGPLRPLHTFTHALRYRIEDAVTGIECPVLVVRGSRDPLVSRDWAAELASLARDGQLSLMPGGVHAMTYENPVELARVVDYFFSGIDRSREFRQDGG